MPKFNTIAIDSGAEWARLTFSYDMKKHAGDYAISLEKIRAVNNYPGATERINMVVRRLKDFRDKGIEIVLITHEQLEKVYAKGGMITQKGSVPQEPIAVKGWPDFPGSTCPQEVMRACDNVFRVKRVNGKPQWIARPESVGGGGDDWEVKDRFNALVLQNGYLPANWAELSALAKANPLCYWKPPYITMLYGPPGIGKTRSLLSFPLPLAVLDIDRGAGSIAKEAADSGGKISIFPFNAEEMDDYQKFLNTLEACAQ